MIYDCYSGFCANLFDYRYLFPLSISVFSTSDCMERLNADYHSQTLVYSCSGNINSDITPHACRCGGCNKLVYVNY